MKRILSSLRARTTVAFLLVSLLPILGLALALDRTLSRAGEESSERRVDFALNAARRRVQDLSALARDRVRDIVERDLPLARPRDDSELTSPGELRHELPILDIVEDGRIVASHHWPAGLGLADTDLTFPPNETIRLQAVAGGLGAERRLTVTARQATTWRGRRFEVRGGYLLDDDFLDSLSTPLGMTVGLWDAVRGEWHSAPSAPLRSWRPPARVVERGGVSLGGRAYRFGAEALAPGLYVAVAVPADELQAVSVGLRRLTIGVAAIAVAAGLAAALWLSSWIAGPVQRLAAALPGLARGERPLLVAETGVAEVARLAEAFNQMTAELGASRERLLQAERVAAWREMARRLAHELKNPLFPVQVSIETLQLAAARSPQLEGTDFGRLFREATCTILEELRVLRGIIDEFSRFARLPRPTVASTDMNAVVRQVLALHAPRAGPVRIETRLAEDLAFVPGDRDLLGLAIGNLVGNALDAMPEGGVLRLVTEASVEGVRVEVADSGPGIPQEQRARLFTPYFTTKPGGTGLGLSIAQSVIADHGGRIDVQSEPGLGTVFTLTLPGVPRPNGSSGALHPFAAPSGQGDTR